MSSSAVRLSRLLALVPWLRVNDGIPMAQAAAHFGIDEEQLERDLNLLICCGLPGYTHAELVDIQFWDDGRIHVLDPQTIGEPLRLTGEEAMALLIALRLLAQIPGDHDRDVLLAATVRLEEAVRARGVDVDGAASIVIEPGADHGAVIAEALAGGADLEIEYGAANEIVSVRTIEPIRVVSHDGHTYVEARCRAAGALRTFRLDRIMRASIVPRGGAGSDEEPSGDAQVTAWESARIRLHARWAEDAFPGSERSGDGTLRAPIVDRAWLIGTILSLGGAAEVLEPADLRAEVADAARAALASYA